jgi:hypothetical protein
MEIIEPAAGQALGASNLRNYRDAGTNMINTTVALLI